jgi:hypothetical protein
MPDSAPVKATHPGPPRTARALRGAEGATLAVSTLLVWSHTIDEIRIGEYIAVPAALATAALLVGWSRARRLAGLFAVLLSAVWVGGAIPYHVVPLLQGAVTWQNVSGLQQLAGGLGLLAMGAHAVIRRRRCR